MAQSTFRVDWSADNGDTVQVRYFEGSASAARAFARAKSKTNGSAYLIRSDNGVDFGQIVYWSGVADGKNWSR